MTLVLQVLVSTILAYTTWCIASLVQNRTLARRIGLPYIYFPISEFNVSYYCFHISPVARWFFRSGLLPRAWLNLVYMSNTASRWEAGYNVHAKYGDTCLLLTPGSVSCQLADADAINEVVTSRTRFAKPIWQYAILRLFGDSVVTTEGSDWVRHRKLTQVPFNERNSSLVWSDSLSQACGLLHEWTGNTTPPVNQTVLNNVPEKLRSMTLHVISSAGFGVYIGFRESSGASKSLYANEAKATNGASEIHEPFSDANVLTGCTKSYREALEYFNRHTVQILVTMKAFPRWVLNYSPRFIRQYVEGHDNLERYLRQLLATERSKLGVSSSLTSEVKDTRRNNILSILVRQEELAAATETKQAVNDGESMSSSSVSLTDAEILGNVYIFALAGHETTAVTLIYTYTMLALHPQYQAWLHTSLQNVLAGQPSDPQQWQYSEVFPQLTACLCVMYETLRLFPPVPNIPKWTGDSPQTLTVAGVPHQLPAHFSVSINVAGLHKNPKYYGPTAELWEPTRWDPANKDSFLYSPPVEAGTTGTIPSLNRPVKGAFMPFSDGSRGCLGKKFAEVEFAATLAVVCSKWKVGLKREPGETEEMAKERVWGVVRRSNNEGTLGMRKAFGFVLEKWE